MRRTPWLQVLGAAVALAAWTGHAPAAGEPTRPARPPRVIVVVGDGMGQGALEATSIFASGSTGRLFLQGLPHRGTLTTLTSPGKSPTDSAAAATAMACGIFTDNEKVGIDRAGQPVQNLVELARARGLAAGVVTTATLSHATPGAFTVHVDSRWHENEIAASLVRETQPEVMLGGGSANFLPSGRRSERRDDGLIDDLRAAGYRLAFDRADLARQAADPGTTRIAGLFSSDHMDWDVDLTEDSKSPRLDDLVRAALAVLERDPDGFFLLVEGARIDMAAHSGRLDGVVSETLGLDRAVKAIADWADGRDELTLIVTADHETGGLKVIGNKGRDRMPDVAWDAVHHTRAPVGVFASGPGTEVFDGATHDLRWVYEVARARITGEPFRPPLGEGPGEAAGKPGPGG